ncbi:MAG: hypothetical protein EOP53_00310 [Sphingobacteriales bacterium]|nr:MAG: hypothetical protein EOP53_00310 [Sphingobacteriales bacterium]
MREYSIKNWEKAISDIAKIAVEKKYAERFRLEYFQLISNHTSATKSLENALLHWLSFFNIYRHLITNQLFAKRIKLTDYKHVIFISTNPSFIKTVSPIINLLLERGEKPLILCGGNHYKTLKKILPQSIFQHTHICESIFIANKLSSFLKLLAAPFLAVKDAGWFAFQPVEKAVSCSSNFARYALVHHYFSKSLTSQFNEKKYTIIGAVDYWFWESLLFTTARATQSKSIVLQHGKLSDLYYPLFAKEFYAWGEADYVEMTEKYLAKPEEIVKAGSPYFDNLYEKILERNPIQKDYKKKNVVFFAQPYGEHKSMSPEYYAEVLGWINSLKNNFPDCNISLKLHPFDKTEFYEKYLGDITINNGNLLDILLETDILLTVDSTTALEAAVAKIPAIQCLPNKQTVYSDMSSTGLTLKAQTFEELTNLIDKLLHDKAFFEQTIYASSKALNYYFYNLGHSIDRIAELLELEKSK